MIEFCSEDNICQNGGTCRDQYEDSFLGVPSCECLSGFAGLYCEVPLNLELKEEKSSSGWKAFFWVVLLIVASLVITYYVLSRHYPEVM